MAVAIFGCQKSENEVTPLNITQKIEQTKNEFANCKGNQTPAPESVINELKAKFIAELNAKKDIKGAYDTKVGVLRVEGCGTYDALDIFIDAEDDTPHDSRFLDSDPLHPNVSYYQGLNHLGNNT